jgi:hypothetical protein
MAPPVSQLRQVAKQRGIPVAEIRGKNAAQLQAMIDGSTENGTSSRPQKKAVVKKAVAKKTTVRRKTTAPKKVSVGRGTVTKKSSAKSKPAVSRRKTGEAKRSTARKTATPKVVQKNEISGRHLLDSTVDFSVTEGWNAREGSAPDRIIKALRKYRGNRSKVYDALKADVWAFVGKVKRNGEKRTKTEANEMLRYRISRTAWDFAIQTDQHEKSGNRVEYATGGTGLGIFKPAGRKTATKKTVTRKTTPTRKTATAKPAAPKRAVGRPKTSTKKTTAPKRATVKRASTKKTAAKKTISRRSTRR